MSVHVVNIFNFVCNIYSIMQLTIKLHFNMTLCFIILCKAYVRLYTIQLSIEAMGGGGGVKVIHVACYILSYSFFMFYKVSKIILNICMCFKSVIIFGNSYDNSNILYIVNIRYWYMYMYLYPIFILIDDHVQSSACTEFLGERITYLGKHSLAKNSETEYAIRFLYFIVH